MISDASPAILAAAAGWLAARAEILLKTREFSDRAVAALNQSRIDFSFVAKLDEDIRAACRIAKIPAPQLEEFFQGRGFIAQ